MIQCYLGLGSNLKTPERQLRQAVKALRGLPRTQVITVAPFYSNSAWGRKTQPRFCNTVVEINTTLTPKLLLKKCQFIEFQQGRVRNVKWGARTLDIDILYFGSMTVSTPTLIIPHPQLFERDFVLIPLKAITNNAKLADIVLTRKAR